MANVNVSVSGGPSARVAWHHGLTALEAMQLAHEAIEPVGGEQFTFALQYYGSSLGYLVTMINETYDSFISRGGESATPFFYWNFSVNGRPATSGVDRTVLSEGDEITFSLQIFTIENQNQFVMTTKHLRQRLKGS